MRRPLRVIILSIPVFSGLAVAQAPDIRTGLYRGRRVTYQVVDGRAIYEGDIILGSPTRLPSGAERAGVAGASIDGASIAYPSSQWPRVAGVVTVPYVVTIGSANMAAAIDSFNKTFGGLMHWQPRVSETDFVNIDFNPADTTGTCEAGVGRQGGAQTLSGSGTCAVSTLLHAIGHIMGLWHEQSRDDRNTYVTVNYQNIIKSLKSNFDQIQDNEQDLGLYDTASLMHYLPFAFTKNGEPALESIPAGIPLSNNGYSAGDIDALKRIYGFTPTQVTITSNPPGLSVSVDNVNAITPQVFSWALNSTHTIAVSGPGQANQQIGGTWYTFGQWNDRGANTHTITVAPGNGLAANPPTSPQVTVYSADFIQLVKYTAAAPIGNGTFGVVPAPASYVGGCPACFVARQRISLQANPRTGYSFYQWNGVPARGLGANPLAMRPQTNLNVQAAFSSQVVTTVATNPAGPGVRVDGNFYYSPKSFASDFDGVAWAPGNTHNIGADSPQLPFSANTRYVFQNWSDGGVNTHSVSVPATNATFVANFETDYKVTDFSSQSCAGSVGVTPSSPTGDGFYPSGSPVAFTAMPTGGWIFTGFEGDLTGSLNPQSLTARDEILVQADFNTIATPVSITSLAPSYVPAGGPGFMLQVNGTGFTPKTVVFVNDVFSSGRMVTYVSATQLKVRIFDSDIATPGAFQIAVENFAAGAGCGAFGSGSFFVTSTAIMPPTVDAVSPGAGTGSTQSFTFTYSDAYGARNLNLGYALFNSKLSSQSGCFVIYNRILDLMYLADDQGSGAVGFITPGYGSISNGQCTLNGGGSAVSQSGNTLIMVLNLTFKPAFPGKQNIFMLAGDLNGVDSGFQLRGTWNTGFTAAPPSISVAPLNGVGSSQSFTITLSDTAGVSNINAGYMLFNSSLNGAGACYVIYLINGNSLYLVGDSGVGLLGPLTPGSGGMVENSQCQLGSGTAISKSATTISIPVNLTFLPAFGGAKTIFGWAYDNQYSSIGWQALGKWARAE